MISITLPTYPQTQQPKSIFKNPDIKIQKKENKIKRVRFLKDCELKNNIKYSIIIFLIISAILYILFKDKLNSQDNRVYIRQILDYISLVTMKIKLLVYNSDQ